MRLFCLDDQQSTANQHMRVVREFTEGALRISVFNWNNKYILKLERGPLEQTFKIPEYDIAGDQQLLEVLTPSFLTACNQRFDAMETDWREALSDL